MRDGFKEGLSSYVSQLHSAGTLESHAVYAAAALFHWRHLQPIDACLKKKKGEFARAAAVLRADLEALVAGPHKDLERNFGGRLLDNVIALVGGAAGLLHVEAVALVNKAKALDACPMAAAALPPPPPALSAAPPQPPQPAVGSLHNAAHSPLGACRGARASPLAPQLLSHHRPPPRFAGAGATNKEDEAPPPAKRPKRSGGSGTSAPLGVISSQQGGGGASAAPQQGVGAPGAPRCPGALTEGDRLMLAEAYKQTYEATKLDAEKWLTGDALVAYLAARLADFRANLESLGPARG